MKNQKDTKELLEYLRWVAERVSRSKFGSPDKIFELARLGKYPDYIVDLAESFGMMIVKVEAREFGLEKNLQEMKDLNQKLNDEIEQKIKFEEALIESETKYRSLIENTQDGIFILQNKKIAYHNSRFTEILGFDPATDLTNKTLSDFINQDSLKIIFKHVNRLLNNDSKYEHFILNILLENHDLVNLDCLSSRIQFNNKAATQHTIRDISQHLRLEKELQRAQKLESLGRLSGGIAHNFNNILSVINGYSEILLKERMLPQKCQPYLEEINNAGKQAVALVHQLLTFGKQQIGKLEYISLNKKIIELIQMVQYLIGENIEISTNLCPGEIIIKSFSGQIEQILLNLVLNARDAIKALPDSVKVRKITVSTVAQVPIEQFQRFNIEGDVSQYALFTVSDTGVGISDEKNHEIFEPFYTTKGGHEGIGIGLSSVYGMVSQNNGYIRFSSRSEEETIFYIYWPKADLSSLSALESQQTLATLQGGESILLVEDQESVRKVVNIVLESLGYKVTAVASGEDALALLREKGTEINLVLSDIILQKMSGKDLVNSIKSINPDMKIILMSGYSHDDLNLDQLLGKNVRFIYKPFTKEKIARHIKEILLSK